MNVMYYRMVNGYGYYPQSIAGTTPNGAGILGSATGGALLGSGASAAAPNGTTSHLGPAAGPLVGTAATSLMPKWIVPNFSATQIQYMFRRRMDPASKVNKAVKCDICNITLNSEQQAQQHYSGKNHLKKVRQIGKKKDKEKDGESGSDPERRRSKDKNRRDKKGRRKKDGDGDGEGDDDDDDDDDDSKKDEDEDCSDKDDDNQSDKEEQSDAENPDKPRSVHSEESQDSCSSSSNKHSQDNNDQSNDLEGSKTVTLKCQRSSQSQSQNQCDESDILGNGGKSNDNESNVRSESGNGKPSNCLREGVVDWVGDHESAKLPSEGSKGVLPENPPNGIKPELNLTKTIAQTQIGGLSTNENQSFNLPGDSVPSLVIPDKSRASLINAVSTAVSSSINSSLSSVCSTSSSAAGSSRYSSSSNVRPTYSQRAKRPYSPPRIPSSNPSSLSHTGSSMIPYKKPRNTYMPTSLGGMVSGLDMRSQLMAGQAPHLALTANSIPAYSPLQTPVRHMVSDSVTPTAPQLTMLRPMIQSTMPSLSSYTTTPQYVTQASGSYPFQYQAIPSSDLSSLSQRVLNPYYPQTIPTVQTPTLLAQAAPDSLTTDPTSLMASDLMGSYFGSKDVLGQQFSLKSYTGSVPTSTGLPAGYGYGTSIQAISIQAMGGGDPSMYQTNPTSPFTSTPSPPYLSLSGGGGTAAPAQVQPSTLVTPTQPAIPATVPQRSSQPQYGVMNQSQSSAEAKLDPVAQAVYNNVLGNLPTKRKKEIPCRVCDQVFNSDAQARAHFIGTKHAKKQKVTEMRQQGELAADEDATCTKKSWGLPFHCDLCNVSVNSELQFQAHQSGEKHQNKAKAAAGRPFIPISATTNTSTWNEIPGNQSGWFYCNVCDISVSTATSLQQHIMTGKHKGKMASQKSAAAAASKNK